MAIRFRLAAGDLDRIAFAYSPLLEAVLSLHVLVEPKHHPLQHPWVREMRRLRPALKREIAGFSFLYRRTFPDVLLPSDAAEYPSFDAELERIRALDPGTAAYELTRPLYDHGGREPRDPHLDDPEIRAAILRNARAIDPDCEALIEVVFDDPHALVSRLADVLAAYWEAAFEAEWTRLEPQLADAVSTAGRQLADRGLYSLLVGLWPQLRVDVDREEFGLDVPHDHTVEMTGERRLVLVPSAYVWPHVRINCDEPWPLTLIYPAAFVQGAARRELPPADLVRALRAAGDATRLRALKLIAERPRSTQELAPLIGMTESGLSKHLRLLVEAGLLTTRREGYYVLYSLDLERVGDLAHALPAFLEPALR